MISVSSPMKKKNSIPSALDVLEGLMGKSKTPLGQDFQRYRLKTEWEKIVGPTIASKTSPVAYKYKILFVWVVSSTWMNQLHFAKTDILEKINQHMGLGWAKDLRFTLDHKAVTSALESKQVPPEFPVPESPSEDGEPPRDH